MIYPWPLGYNQPLIGPFDEVLNIPESQGAAKLWLTKVWSLPKLSVCTGIKILEALKVWQPTT